MLLVFLLQLSIAFELGYLAFFFKCVVTYHFKVLWAWCASQYRVWCQIDRVNVIVHFMLNQSHRTLSASSKLRTWKRLFCYVTFYFRWALNIFPCRLYCYYTFFYYYSESINLCEPLNSFCLIIPFVLECVTYIFCKSDVWNMFWDHFYFMTFSPENLQQLYCFRRIFFSVASFIV